MVKLGSAMTLTGRLTAEQTFCIVSTSLKARRIEHVGAGLLERLQPLDRVVEVRPAHRKFSARAVKTKSCFSARAASAAAATRSTACENS